jgi:hypothetical protein
MVEIVENFTGGDAIVRFAAYACCHTGWFRRRNFISFHFILDERII